MNAVVTGVLVHLAAQLAQGFWISRRVTTEDDFLLAGRSLGYVLSTFTIRHPVFGLVFAAPTWRRKLTTLADLFRLRYGVGVERLAVLLMARSRAEARESARTGRP